MQVAIGKRRTIVQNEGGTLRVLALNSSVNGLVTPVLQSQGLAFDEIAAHREIRLREIECVF